MRDDAKAIRKAQIEQAAYTVLAEKGYLNMSMLAVARAAKASNETLYRWYGDKTGLFKALIEANAELVAAQLEAHLERGDDPALALRRLGPALLDMLLGDRAVALNRAAASDVSGTLGLVLAQSGRGRVFPKIVALFERLVSAKTLEGAPPELARLYVDLLLGDLQIRRVTGAIGPLGQDDVAKRAQQAETRLFALAAPR